MAAGAAHGLVDAGYRAIESLRLEKGYRAWGADIGPDHSPLMAGLGFAVKLRSEPRRSSAATRSRRSAAAPLPRLLAGFAVDDPDVVLLGRETIYRDGRRVGWLSSGGWGHTVGRALGYGYVRDRGRGRRGLCARAATTSSRSRPSGCPPRSSSRPPYDPGMARVRA